MARKLTKTEVELIAQQIKQYYDANFDDIVITIHENVLTEGHITNSTDRMDLSSDIISTKVVIRNLIQNYTELYADSFKGVFADRFAKLTIGWVSHISSYLTNSTKESDLLLSVSGKTFSGQDRSAVMHSFGRHYQ